MEALQQYASDSDSGSCPPTPSSERHVSCKRQKRELDEGGKDKKIAAVKCQVTSLPDLPSEFLESHSDNNPAPCQGAREHAGKIRTFPHVEGNFAVHVYIPVTLTPAGRATLRAIVTAAKAADPALQTIYNLDGFDDRVISVARGAHACAFRVTDASPLTGLDGWQPPTLEKDGGREGPILHISLSHVVPVRMPQIESLIAVLRRHLEGRTGRPSGRPRGGSKYAAQLATFDVLVNEEGTRSFLALMVAEGKGPVQAVNEAFTLHGLPQFYEDPRPHVSIAWLPGNKAPQLSRVAARLSQQFPPAQLQGCRAGLAVEVFTVKCKVGQRDYVVWSKK
eukprot:jgi/Mesvir1/6418/Mv19509-RA.2